MTLDETVRAMIEEIVRAEVARVLKAGGPPPVEPEYMTDRQVAACVGMSPQTFRQMRCDGEGPPFITVGRAVRYRWSDVVTWFDARKVRPGAR